MTLKPSSVNCLCVIELERLLDDTRLSAKEELEARLTHRRQLKAEREAQGLSVDEDTLDAIQDKEEKEKPRRLVRHFMVVITTGTLGKPNIWWTCFHQRTV